MNSYKKLVGNSFVFAVGNLGSKIISIILVPIYTYYLSAAEYGTVDLLLTTVTVLLPVISASSFEAVLRFSIDKRYNASEVLGQSLIITTIGYIFFAILYPLFAYFNLFGPYLIYLYFLLALQMLEKALAQYTRAINFIKIYSANGILLTFTTGILNVLFLVVFKLGVSGYLTSMILANIISILFLFFTTRLYRDFTFKHFNGYLIKQMLHYSLPMIPNSLMWWLINASSRYFITFSVGAVGNGLFAVASKIPAIINIISQVFSQAWQISAIEEFENKNKSNFYSNVFIYLSSAMIVGASGITIIVKLLFINLFAREYFMSWKVVPFLLLSSVFSTFSSFLGTNYLAAKETKGVFKTSVYGGMLSLIFNVILIPPMGIIGAGLSSMISFFLMFVLRVFDTRKFIQMTIDWKGLLGGVGLVLIQTGILFMGLEPVIEYSINTVLFILVLLINRHIFKLVLKFFLQKAGKNR